MKNLALATFALSILTLSACSSTPSTVASATTTASRKPSSTVEMDIDHVDNFIYKNERFGFEVTYVAAFFEKGRESDNNDGTTAAGFDKHGTMLAYGSWDLSEPKRSLDQAYADALNEIQKDPTQKITYKMMNKNAGFYVVSGYKKSMSQIFYIKTYVADGALKTLDVTYDVSAKSTYDMLVDGMSKSFATTRPQF